MKRETIKDFIILVAIVGSMILMAIIAWIFSAVTETPYY